MGIYLKNTKFYENIPRSVIEQACVKSIYNAKLSTDLKNEIDKFISRNILPDCGKVPPNCLKAHLIKTAKKFGLSRAKINHFKRLFKAKIGFNGYYLDNGKLKKV
jgi:hypothetical protein